MRKLLPLLIVPLLALLAVAAAAAMTVETCELPSCDPNDLPLTYTVPAGFAPITVDLETESGTTYRFGSSGSAGGYTVANLDPWSEGYPVTISGSGERLRLVRYHLLPAPPMPPDCPTPPFGSGDWYCTDDGQTVIIRETYLPLVLAR